MKYSIRIIRDFVSRSYKLFVVRYTDNEHFLLKVTVEEIKIEEGYDSFPFPSAVIPPDAEIFRELVSSLQELGFIPSSDKATLYHLEDLRKLLGLSDRPADLNIERKKN